MDARLFVGNEIRNSNIEARNNFEKPRFETFFVWNIGILKIRICFGFRASDFEFKGRRFCSSIKTDI
jgi:hypothetical protein